MAKSAQETNAASQKDGATYEFDFRTWHFYWLARADRSYLSTLEPALQRRDLDIGAWRVLMILHAKQLASVSDLADHSITKLSTMTRIVQRMSKDGLVACAPNENDRRITMVSITEKGELAGKSAWEEAKRIAARAFDGFSAAEKRQLVSLLKRLDNNLADR